MTCANLLKYFVYGLTFFILNVAIAQNAPNAPSNPTSVVPVTPPVVAPVSQPVAPTAGAPAAQGQPDLGAPTKSPPPVPEHKPNPPPPEPPPQPNPARGPLPLIPDTRPPEAKFYFLSNRYAQPIADDGFPIRKEALIFTDAELLKTDDPETVRNALKREQKRLTRIFFSEHPIFKQFTPNALTALINEVTAANDKGLTDLKTMAELNNFKFENFRNHLIHVSHFILLTRHYKIENPTGEVEEKTMMDKYTPKDPFDYMSLGALVLFILLFGVTLFRRR